MSNVYPRLREANQARHEEWATGEISLSYRGNELAGEVGEAMEAFVEMGASTGRVCNTLKKFDREKMGMVGSRATHHALAEELADVMICVDLIAMQFGIDMREAVRDKFNATSVKYGLKTRMGDYSTI